MGLLMMSEHLEEDLRSGVAILDYYIYTCSPSTLYEIEE
jgi:hypothetical protein